VSRVVRFAWVTLGINVVVILLGALVRATGSGAGCGESWPTCDGQIVPAVLEGARAVEFTHRVASGIALIAVGVLAVWVFRVFGRGHLARKAAVLSVAAIIGEALIGAWLVLAALVGSDQSVARTVSVPLHLVNTLLLLAALTLTAFWADGGGPLRPGSDRSFAIWAGAIAVGTILVAATGAVTALADTLFPKDAVGFALADLAGSEHLLTRMRTIHPLAATALGLALILLARRRWSATDGTVTVARLLVVLVVLQLAAGLANVLLFTPVWMQLVHLLLADGIWVGFVWFAAAGLQSPGEDQPSSARSAVGSETGT
jgi:heme A synthase